MSALVARFHVGSVSPEVAAPNHSICEGPCAVLHVSGAGYPAGIGWHPRTESFARWVCDAMNEKAAREGYRVPNRHGVDPWSVET